MKTIKIAFFSTLLVIASCAERDGSDNGPDAGTEPTVDAADGDEVPGPETAAWACRGGKDGAGDYFECNPARIQADALTDYWVGECPSEGIFGYWSGGKVAAQLAGNGWARIYLKGTATDCVLTVSQCSDPLDSKCWLQYPKRSGNDPDGNNPYRACGANGDCGMKLKRNADHTPTPLGN